MSHSAESVPQQQGQALAIIAIIVAAISLLLCWIPIVNNVVFFLGVLGAILGLIAWLRARKGKSGGRGLALAATIISVLSIAGVLATQAFYGAMLDGIGESISDSADGETEKSDDDKEAEASAKTLALGKVAKVGSDYAVAVTNVNLNANDDISQANEFNDPPKGQYVVATLTVKYIGKDEGDPWLDLSAEFSGSDSRNYDTSTCSVDMGEAEGSMDQPTLRNGGKATYSVCFDLPEKAISGGTIMVAESFSLDEDRQYWEINP